MYLCIMNRQEILENGLCFEIIRLAKELPNDAELGEQVRAAVLSTEDKLKELAKEN